MPITNNDIENKMKKIKKDIKNLNNLVTSKKSNEKFKLGSWHHYNNMINKINKICSKDKDLKQSDTLISITEVLSEYIRKTPKKEDSDRVKTVTELRDNLEKYMGWLENVDELVRVSDKDFKSTILKNRYSKNAPLFPKGRPHPDDVKQGILTGDCYLISALISIAKTDPKSIVDCFVDYPKGSNPSQEALDKFNKLKHIRIRLFKYESDRFYWDVDKQKLVSSDKNKITYTPAGKVIIDIDKSSVTLLEKKTLWVSLLEKAFAVYRKRGFDIEYYNALKYKKLISPRILYGGDSYTQTVITRKICKATIDNEKGEREKKFSSTEYKQNRATYDKVKRLLENGSTLTASYEGGTFGLKKGLWKQHAYALTAVKEENGYLYIQVLDPHRFSYSRGYKKGKDGKMHGKTLLSKSPKGSSWVELNDFRKHFSFSYTKKEKKEPEI